jgi:hypothetical protein
VGQIPEADILQEYFYFTFSNISFQTSEDKLHSFGVLEFSANLPTKCVEICQDSFQLAIEYSQIMGKADVIRIQSVRMFLKLLRRDFT